MDRTDLKRLAKKITSTISLKLVSPFIRPAIEAILDAHNHNIPRAMRQRAVQTTADFIIEHMPEAQWFPGTFPLLDHVLAMLKPGPGLICEFGVYKGRTLNFIASRQARPVFGFDSFEGLPEDWIDGLPKGAFKVAAPPAVAANVTLVKGWFDQTIPPFLASHPGDALFLHVDCDLYSSTRTIFEHFAPRIEAGTVIVFDEYFNYPGWQLGEYKAFQEASAEYGWRFKYLGYAAMQVAIEITSVGS